MKKLLNSLFALSFLAILFSACGSSENGQLIGVLERPTWKGINPYGMVYIPSGTLHIGPGDQDVTNTFVQRPKTISIQGFFMDDTEITNNEYRQFVYWVKDSLAHVYLDHYQETDDGEEYLDWESEIDWSDETLEDLYYQGDEKFAGRKELNVDNMIYEYSWYDWQSAAHDRTGNRTKHIKKESVEVYPDTLVWISKPTVLQQVATPEAANNL